MKNKFNLPQIVMALAITLIGLYLLFPIYWMIVTAFKVNMDIYKMPPQMIPIHFTLQNYLEIFTDNSVVLYFVNNIIVSAGTTSITLIASSLAGYSLSRYPSSFGNISKTALLSTQMFPLVGLIPALYVIFRNLGLIDSRMSIIIAMSAVTIPFFNNSDKRILR